MCGRCTAMESVFFATYASESNFNTALRAAVRAGVQWDKDNPEAANEHHQTEAADDGLHNLTTEVRELAADIATGGREASVRAYQEKHQVELQRQYDEMMELLYTSLAASKTMVDQNPGDKVRGMLEVSAAINQSTIKAGANPFMPLIVLSALVVEVCSSGAYDALQSTRTSLDGFQL
jgi:hypothetical protein